MRTPITALAGPRHGVDELVRREVGLRVRAEDLRALADWTGKRLRALPLPGIDRFRELLGEDSAAGRLERELLTVRFTTGESYFLRDEGQFALLANRILPELIERRAAQRTLRLWSAGCSTGEEAYSLGMLLDELGPRVAGWNILILGTDINAKALEKARRGVYGDWSFRSLDAERKQRYFRPHGDQWQINAHLRDRVTFRRGDLIRDRFPDAEAGLNDFDLILCRNVFIYLDAHAVQGITAKFAEVLADGGYLVTAHSELFGHDTAPLRARMFAQSAAFQKTAQPAAETDLGEALGQAQGKAQPPAVPALRPPLRVERQVTRVEQRAAPAMPPAAPAGDCDVLMQAAWRHADRGMREEAKEDCCKAIETAAFDPRPYYLLAQLAQEGGEPAQAKSLLKKVIYLDPSSIAAYLELGALHAQAGDNELSRRTYESACKALRKLPAQTAVAPYSESTAAEILAHVERLLGKTAGAETAASVAPTAGPRRTG